MQRYGAEITGGSEMLCRQVAERLLGRYDVEVITTSALDHLSWQKHYPAGLTTLNGVSVRRFDAAEERNRPRFQELYDRLFASPLTPAEESDLIRYQGPYAPALVEHLRTRQNDYAAFLFFTYLYYPTIAGLPEVRHKAALVPTLHDESSLYLHTLDALFHMTPWLLFLTPEEMLLAQRRFNLPAHSGRLAGIGIEDAEVGAADPAWPALRDRLRDKRVLTYIGRVENGKGCDELTAFFEHWAAEQGRRDVVLLLLGNRTMKLPDHPQIIAPGFVSEYVKYHALEHTDVAVAPSPLESLCIAALESWLHQRPVLANGRSPVLAGHC
ncbi:MAG TPA: glycosyltransferase, partial [Beijerinckiaceae bacterium]|nr:glycosyltransferase [Beijerinckiaceae bacterium]